MSYRPSSPAGVTPGGYQWHLHDPELKGPTVVYGLDAPTTRMPPTTSRPASHGKATGGNKRRAVIASPAVAAAFTGTGIAGGPPR